MTDADGNPAMKPFWEITEGDVEAALAATTWYPANRGYFRGGGFSSQFVSKGGMPVTMARLNLVSGTGPVLQIAEGWTVELPTEVHDILDQRTDPTWPTHWFVPRTTGEGAVPRRLHRDGQLGRQPRRHQLRPHRRRPDQPGVGAADPGPHAQRGRGGHLPAVSAWANLGTADPEGADFRACANFGPLYGNEVARPLLRRTGPRSVFGRRGPARPRCRRGRSGVAPEPSGPPCARWDRRSSDGSRPRRGGQRPAVAGPGSPVARAASRRSRRPISNAGWTATVRKGSMTIASRQVVEADHRDVLGHPDPELAEGVHGADGDEVVAGEHGRRPRHGLHGGDRHVACRCRWSRRRAARGAEAALPCRRPPGSRPRGRSPWAPHAGPAASPCPGDRAPRAAARAGARRPANRPGRRPRRRRPAADPRSPAGRRAHGTARWPRRRCRPGRPGARPPGAGAASCTSRRSSSGRSSLLARIIVIPASRAAASTPWASVVKNGFVMSGSSSAIVSVRLARRLRASVLGMYPVSASACSHAGPQPGADPGGGVDDP